jgi:hypothetical protein
MLLAVAACASTAAAQVPGRDSPGPYVVDLRGATSGLPTDAPFYPPAGITAAVPSRGLGFDVGAHVYLLRLGGPTLGVGASFMQVRGTSPDASATLRLLAPQVSFNFGSGNGWSHLSLGVGTARMNTELRGDVATGTASSGSLRALSLGGGARWFLTGHAAVGFDVRFHRVAAGEPDAATAGSPRVTLLTASVGVSVR